MYKLIILFSFCQISFYQVYTQEINTDSLLNTSVTLLKKNREGAQALLIKLKAQNNLDSVQKAKVFNNLGLIYYYESLYDSSIFYYEKSIRHFRSASDSIRMKVVLKNLGLVYRQTGQLQESLYYYLLALSYSKEVKVTKEYAGIQNSIGTIYHLVEDYTSAKKHYQEALEAYQVIGDSGRISKAYNNVGISFFELEEFEDGKRSYLASLSYNPSNHNAAKNLGEYYVLMDKEDSATIFLGLAWKLREENKDTIGLTAILNQYAVLEMNNKKWEEADSLLRYAEVLLEKVPDGNKLMENMRLQKIMALQFQQFQRALKVDSVIDSVNHYLFQEERLKVNESFLERVEIENEQLEIDRFLISDQLSLSQQTSRYRLFLIGGISLIAALLMYFYRRSKIEQRKISMLNQQLNILNEDLTNEKVLTQLLASDISHKTKNTLQLLGSLIRLQASASRLKETKIALREVFNRVETFAAVHNKLLEQNIDSQVLTNEVDLRTYIQEVISGLEAAEVNNSIVFQCPEDLMMHMDRCLYVGLIINELGVNFFKHVNHELRLLKIETELAGNNLMLNVIDNGSGLNGIKEKKSFGLGMINSLVIKLAAKHEIKSGNYGLMNTFTIPIYVTKEKHTTRRG